jgi:hypothetical protein
METKQQKKTLYIKVNGHPVPYSTQVQLFGIYESISHQSITYNVTCFQYTESSKAVPCFCSYYTKQLECMKMGFIQYVL